MKSPDATEVCSTHEKIFDRFACVNPMQHPDRPRARAFLLHELVSTVTTNTRALDLYRNHGWDSRECMMLLLTLRAAYFAHMGAVWQQQVAAEGGEPEKVDLIPRLSQFTVDFVQVLSFSWWELASRDESFFSYAQRISAYVRHVVRSRQAPQPTLFGHHGRRGETVCQRGMFPKAILHTL